MVRVRRLIRSSPLSIAAIEPNRREAEGQVNRSDPASIQLLETAKHAHRMRQFVPGRDWLIDGLRQELTDRLDVVTQLTNGEPIRRGAHIEGCIHRHAPVVVVSR
jgi:hypothetical protein